MDVELADASDRLLEAVHRLPGVPARERVAAGEGNSAEQLEFLRARDDVQRILKERYPQR